MKPRIIIFLSLALAFHVHAGSATWNLNPTSGDWNTAANWIPNTVPNGPDNIATFGLSNQTAISVSIFGTEVNELIFNPSASAFTITNDRQFTISGTGITNNSGIVQNFVVTPFSNYLVLTNSATAGDMTFFTVTSGAFMQFHSTASAGNGTFVIEESSFGSDGGTLTFSENSSAGNGSFTVNGGSIPAGTFGDIVFLGGTAGNGVFVINGGTAPRALGGLVLFAGGTAGNATLIANPGTNGGDGGLIRYRIASDPDQSEARIEVFGNGKLDLIWPVNGGRTVGSIEGDGWVRLGDNLLITGANNLSTIFAGTIQDTGSLQKIGTGSLTLTGANTYRGGTTIDDGKLTVNNRDGSGTGSGPVQVNAGHLSGGGVVTGAVTIGTGSGSGAFLAPSGESHRPATLTIQSALSFKADATYIYKVNTKKTKADKVVANGVTIESGAQFSCGAAGNRNKKLPTGQTFVAISNTAATLINGTFANLADGSTITAGNNTFQANYEGGDGNDLTLTVIR